MTLPGVSRHRWEADLRRIEAMFWRSKTADERIAFSFHVDPENAESIADTVRCGEPIVLDWGIEDARLVARLLLDIIADAEKTRN